MNSAPLSTDFGQSIDHLKSSAVPGEAQPEAAIPARNNTTQEANLMILFSESGVYPDRSGSGKATPAPREADGLFGIGAPALQDPRQEEQGRQHRRHGPDDHQVPHGGHARRHRVR